MQMNSKNTEILLKRFFDFKIENLNKNTTFFILIVPKQLENGIENCLTLLYF